MVVVVIMIVIVHSMFSIYRQPNKIEEYWLEFISNYKSDILSVHSELWNEEAIHGSSCKSLEALQYHLAFYWVYLIYLDVQYGNTEWSYYENKYDIENKRKQFACNGIDIDILFDIFGLPASSSDGLGGMGIEIDFFIPPYPSVNSTTYDMETLLSNTGVVTHINNISTCNI